MKFLKDIKINVPADVNFILTTLIDNGFEAYIVGGCVRDSILGLAPKDWDITTRALPAQVKSLFNNTVDSGIQHGTVMVIIHGTGYEVTTFRIDGEYKDSRHPESVEFTPSLEEDLKRRDFTINAFAYNDAGVVDMFDGMADLNAGIIRAVGDPYRRFDEDALRIMRAVRFAAQLSYTIEPETLGAIRHFAERIGNVSMERIRVEFEKTLFSANPSYVNMFREFGLAPYIIRDNNIGNVMDKSAGNVTAAHGEAAGAAGNVPADHIEAADNDICSRCFDEEASALYERFTLKTMKELPSGACLSEEPEHDVKILRLAAFFKNLSSEEVKKVMRSMTFDNKTKDLVAGLISCLDIDVNADRIQLKKYLKTYGAELVKLVFIYKNAAEPAVKELSDIFGKNEPYSIAQLKVNGSELIAAGIPAGETIGRVLNFLTDKVIENPCLNSKEVLTELAGEYV
ncbi:MAG: hypothetical protein HUJ75_00710 [Parasporobacterium sp.]|nr:hypothetical protein [Parasporobacterium sp.]